VLAGAEEAYRWRDASGGLHYGNVAGLAPADAEPVKTTIGRLTLPPSQPVSGVPATRARAMAERAVAPGTGSCCAFGGSYTVVLNNPHELADQVKQASLLDALGVPWRRGCCL
jgi:hypothetical protein